jgi:hypothetical protein
MMHRAKLPLQFCSREVTIHLNQVCPGFELRRARLRVDFGRFAGGRKQAIASARNVSFRGLVVPPELVKVDC